MSFISLILEWYYKNKRAFPWRENKSVYRVWLSEIILQQTRVNQGMNYYHKFVETFDSVHDLANASEQKVLNLWQGLGYYSRARNLHKTAKIVSGEMKGEFPKNYDDLKKLPGIGPYTAAAIASICYNEKVPAIDGNAYRVYARIFGLEKDISDANAHRFFFDFAKEKMPQRNAGDYNEAIMELGATVCLPTSPKCDVCPVSKLCVARETGKTQLLPIKTKKIKTKKRFLHYFFIQNEQNREFYIKKRIAKDVWLNLYDFPLIEMNSSKLKENIFAESNPTFLHEIKHILTHQILHIKFYKIELDSTEFEKLNKEDWTKIGVREIEHTPFPKPIATFLHEYFYDLD